SCKEQRRNIITMLAGTWEEQNVIPKFQILCDTTFCNIKLSIKALHYGTTSIAWLIRLASDSPCVNNHTTPKTIAYFPIKVNSPHGWPWKAATIGGAL